jgi:hypothetical protein
LPKAQSASIEESLFRLIYAATTVTEPGKITSGTLYASLTRREVLRVSLVPKDEEEGVASILLVVLIGYGV